MISVFRNNDVLNIFLLLPYAILLRISSLVHPVAYQGHEMDTILMEWFFAIIPSPVIQSILAIILVFSQGIIINLIANNHRLHRLPSALSGMVYIMLASALPEFQQLTPALIGMTFVLIAILNVFRTYNLNIAAKNIFNAALASSVAAMCYLPYISIILALFIGLSMMRNFKLKEKLQFLVGYGVSFWIVGSFLYFLGYFKLSLFQHIDFPGSISSFYAASSNSWISLGVVVLFLLVALLNYYNFMKKKGIDIRKKIDFFYWLLLCGFLALILFKDAGFQLYFFLITPLALFLSMGIMMVRNIALAELFHLFALAGIFYLHFF